ncbi:MAG: MBL fold metallo-hydrolase [Acidobacteriota bacterium]
MTTAATSFMRQHRALAAALPILTLTFAAAGFAAEELLPGVDWIPGRYVATAQPDGNTVVFRAPEGLVVVDTGRHADHTQAIVDFAAAHHAQVKAIVNTHWHLDHISGNKMLRDAFPGVRIYASAALSDALQGFLADYRAELDSMVKKTADEAKTKGWREEMARIDSGPALAPDEVIKSSGRRAIAGRTLDLELEDHSVTAGDVWIFDPATRVLAAGDLVTLPAPFFDTACSEHWKASLDRLAKFNFEILVPGHGKPIRRAEFETYRRAFDNLVACGTSKRSKADCVAGWQRDAGSLIAKEDEAAARGLVDYYVENSMRGDPTAAAKLCGR